MLAATAQAMVPVFYQRMLFNTTMMAAAGTTRMSQIVTKLPRSVAKTVLPLGSDPKRPASLQRWAAAEMRRHSTRAWAASARGLARRSTKGATQAEWPSPSSRK